MNPSPMTTDSATLKLRAIYNEANLDEHLKPEARKEFWEAITALESMNKNDKPKEKMAPVVDDHTWQKTTTVHNRAVSDLPYDKYVCSGCGITAKRYAEGGMVHDLEFRPKCYDHCNTARIHLRMVNARLASYHGGSRDPTRAAF